MKRPEKVPLRILKMGTPAHYIPCFKAGPSGTRRLASIPVHFAQVEGLPEVYDAIICTSDLQAREVTAEGEPGRLFGEALAEELEFLLPLEELSLARSGMLLAGDFYAAPDADERGINGDVLPVWKTFHEKAMWVSGILGNHDQVKEPWEDGYGIFSGWSAHLLEESTCYRQGLYIAGLNYIIGDPAKPGRRSETDYLARLRQLLTPQPQILVTHESPCIPKVGEAGSDTLFRALSKARNLLVVCGHIHHREPLHNLPNGVQVLNVDARVVVLTRNEV